MPWYEDLEVFCADVGSMNQGSFAWGRRHPTGEDEEVHEASSIDHMARAVLHQLVNERPVALGFEMPLFIPVAEESALVNKARPCDVNAPAWCSPVGANVLTAGLPQVAWVLAFLREHAGDAPVSFRWDRFAELQSGLLLWEAFVTKGAKGATHEEDARIGVDAFCGQLPSPGDANADDTTRPLSLVAACALWAGWQVEPDDLRSACVLVRAEPSVAG